MNRGMTTVMTAVLAVALAATTAYAMPGVSTRAPVARAETVDGRVLDPRALVGKVVLIFYEDKDSTSQNQVLKDAIKQQGKTWGNRGDAAIYAVADVSAYDFWPARGFVKDAIKEEEQKSGASIYLDWSGSFRKAFAFQTGSSNIVLLGSDNKVKLAHNGVVPRPVRETILQELKR